MRNPYHIAFCVNDNYVEYICVTIKSILETNKNEDFNFHIIIDKITDYSKKKLNGLIESLTSSLYIHIVNDSILSNLKVGCWSKYTWYRILLPDTLINVDKILYLDADTIINNDISLLFKYDITNYAIAGVMDCQVTSHKKYWDLKFNETYLNAGVLLMNLSYWREHDLKNKIIRWAIDNKDKIEFPDQDSINLVCKDCKKVLPLKYGISEAHFFYEYFYQNYSEELKDAYLSPIIIHYCGRDNVPWIKESNNTFTQIWRKYNSILGSKKVKIKYTTKGLNRVKVWIWDLFHNRSEDSRLRVETQLKKYNLL